MGQLHPWTGSTSAQPNLPTLQSARYSADGSYDDLYDSQASGSIQLASNLQRVSTQEKRGRLRTFHSTSQDYLVVDDQKAGHNTSI